jgi:hypothetical protein
MGLTRIGASLTGFALLGLSLVSCGSSETSTPLYTGDNFDSYVVQAWSTPLGGWQSLQSKMWAITTGGVSGNALWFTPNENDWLVHEYGSGDYTLSVQIKHSLTPYQNSTYHTSLIGRVTDINSYYEARLYTSSTQHTTWLSIGKYWQVGSTTHAVELKWVEFFNGDIDPNVYYTLSLQFQGSTITATASTPSIPLVSTSITDDGVSNGPVLTGTKVGIHGDAEVSFHPYYDNFTVTSP